MKVIIPSYNRSDTISTPALVTGVNVFQVHVVVHSAEQGEAYLQGGRIVGDYEMHVSLQPARVAAQRQWAMDHLVKEGEWVVFMDDNVESISIVPAPLYERDELPVQSEQDAEALATAFATKATPEGFYEVCREVVERAEQEGAAFAGFATTNNYYFRGRKWRQVGYVSTHCSLVKKGTVRFDAEIRAMDDYAFTAEHLLRHGRVLINNYVWADKRHYAPGGIGTYADRLEAKQADCVYLMRKYPGLFRYKRKAGCDPKAELQVRFTDAADVQEWRRLVLKYRGALGLR